MANILIMGVGPLPFEPGQKLHAPGIRTWQIATAVAKQRHYVTLCVIEFGDFEGKKGAGRAAATRQDVGFNINMVRLSYHPDETTSAIRTFHLASRFSAVVSTTDIMNGIAADLDLDVPLWLDYNGDPFAEKQLQARLYQHDGSLLPQWQLYLKGLLHGDKFSVCSHAQRHAMIGQLAFSGRLTGVNSGEELVQVLPNCSRVMSEKTAIRNIALKGNKIPASAFVVLWTGGYNTWCDPQTLFAGLEKAMKQDDTIYFATTGGALEGHDNKSFQEFQDLVQASPLKDRFIFLGWVPTEEVGSYYEQADLAIFVDRYSVEGELGTRTRIVDWVQYNIPILCTDLCDLTHEMVKEDLISTFPLNDSDSLASKILEHLHEPSKFKLRAEHALEWFDENYDEAEMLKPLLEWVKAPAFASDRRKTISDTDPRDKAWYSELAKIHSTVFQNDHLKKPSKERTHLAQTDPKKSLKSRFVGLFGRKN